MEQHISLSAVGTIPEWVVNGRRIIPPATHVLVDGTAKWRGSAHACAPIFGPQPDTPDFAGVDLPQHGLVRTGEGQPFIECVYDTVSGFDSRVLTYKKPWAHIVCASVRASEDMREVNYQLALMRPANVDDVMPASIGFHPYFATNGQRARIEYGRECVDATDVDPEDPIFWPRPDDGRPVTIWLGMDGECIEMHLSEDWTHVCVWTDRPDLYVCVEPVAFGSEGPGSYRLLGAVEGLRGKCTMTYRPPVRQQRPLP